MSALIATKAPTIELDWTGKPTVFGSFAGCGEAERETFMYAVQTLAFTLPRGVAFTGGQWAAAIRRSYSQSNPKTAQCLRAIEHVMDVNNPRWTDESIVFNDDTQCAVYRGDRQGCLAHMMQMDSASMSRVPDIAPDMFSLMMSDVAHAEARRTGLDIVAGVEHNPQPGAPGQSDLFRNHWFSLPYRGQGHAVRAHQDHPLRQALELLQHSSVPTGASSTSCAEDGPVFVAMERLTHALGYACLAAYRPRGMSQLRASSGELAALDVASIEASMLDFVGDLVDAGSLPDDPVFLCRPAALVGAGPDLRGFETQLGPHLVAWRLPSDFVQRMRERARPQEAVGEPEEAVANARSTLREAQ